MDIPKAYLYITKKLFMLNKVPDCKKVFLVFIILFTWQQVIGQWYVDKKYGFKINIPDQWNSTHFEENGMLVYKFISSDNNIIIELDAFDIDKSIHVFDLVSDFEENRLPEGFECSSLKDYTTETNIKGKIAIYNGYLNGIAESFSAFYTTNNNKGYVLSTLVPIEKIQEKSEETQAIINSFQLLKSP
jgi:hypothetical protein